MDTSAYPSRALDRSQADGRRRAGAYPFTNPDADTLSASAWGRTVTSKDTVLLVLFAARNEGYYTLSGPNQTAFFNMMGGVCLLGLLWYARPVWWPLGVWVTWQELMNAICSLLWMVRPLPWASEQCSAQTGVNVGLVGMLMLLYLCCLAQTMEAKWR